MAKPHSMTRRAALKHVSAALALPWLESLHASAAEPSPPPVRMAFFYVPYGTNAPGWFPKEVGPDYSLPKSLTPLEPLREDVSVLSGLQHINGRTQGHAGCLNWLTGTPLSASRRNTGISIDQLAARYLGHDTRHASLQVATALLGNASACISYDALGRPLPPVRSPRALFEKLFPASDEKAKAQRRQMLEEDRSVLDLVLAQAKDLGGKLGQADARKLNEYMETVREVEKRVATSEKLLDTPVPQVERSRFLLDTLDPKLLLRTYFDIILLAFQTDQTRVVSFPYSMDEDDSFLDRAVDGITGGKSGHWHEAGHKGDDNCQKMDQWCVDQLAYLLCRLKESKEGASSLLDRTMVVYGGSQVRTHQCTNFPILFAGGKGLGVKHGRHHRYEEGKVPFANLFVTLLQKAQLPVPKFADSTGPLGEL